MKEILSMNTEERSQMFREAAARSDKIKSPIIIEKDFWVCWVLDNIFKTSELRSNITFKGGTSLSKCYGIIDRFSEDCDLTLSKSYLEVLEDTVTVSQKGTKQKSIFLKNLKKAAENKVVDHLKPLLTDIFQKELSDFPHCTDWRLEVDSENKQNLLFHYPTNLDRGENEYIQSAVILEFGARGDNSPNETKIIHPYICDTLPELFDKTPETQVDTLTAVRTFWEKATALHAEHYRKPEKPLKSGIFRHYYDITKLDSAGITDSALKQIDILEIVVRNKITYFADKNAKYDEAKIGTLRLVPNEKFTPDLKQDCERMSNMFFGEPPKFDDVMEKIAEIEERINSYK